MSAEQDIGAVITAAAKLFELGPDEDAVVTVYVDRRRGPSSRVMVCLPEGLVAYVQPDGSTVPIAAEVT